MSESVTHYFFQINIICIVQGILLRGRGRPRALRPRLGEAEHWHPEGDLKVNKSQCASGWSGRVVGWQGLKREGQGQKRQGPGPG